MYEHIAELLDFAEVVAKRIVPGEFDNNNYFMTLVYVEDILDTYGRAVVSRSADENNLDGHALKGDASRRMEALRSTIARLNSDHAFDEALVQSAGRLVKNWKR